MSKEINNATRASSANFVGVSMSGANLRAVVTDANGSILHRREAAFDGEEIAGHIARLTLELRDMAGEIAGVGVAAPGLVNPETGRVIFSSETPQLARNDLCAEIAEACGVPASSIIIENDANAAAYGEHVAGAGSGARNLFYITIGEGVGGALILNDELWRGASGFAGEFGHITINPEGRECVCGNIGCLETVASAPNIVRRARERLFRDNTSSLSRLAANRQFTAADVAREATNGDDFAAMMLERTGRYIGIAVAAVINLLNIERIVIGGDVMAAGDLMLQPIISEAARRSFQPSFEATRILSAQLQQDAAPIGAAMLAARGSIVEK